MDQLFPDNRYKYLIQAIVFTSVFLLLGFKSVRAADQVYYLHTDQVGSIVTVTDGGGQVVGEKSYQAYGSDKQTVGISPSEKSYTGQIKDTTNLYYYNARYYDPVLSRFISADSVQAGNRYAYVGGNPISNSDPSGNRCVPEDECYKEKKKPKTVTPIKPFVTINTSLEENQKLEKKFNLPAGYINITDWFEDTVTAVVRKRNYKIQVTGPIALEDFNRIVSDVGERYNNGKNEYHTGLDISVKQGKEVHAIYAGKILDYNFDKPDPVYGNYVFLEHKFKDLIFYSLYTHLSDSLGNLSVGSEVSAGEAVALSGDTGTSGGAHLHLSIPKTSLDVPPYKGMNDNNYPNFYYPLPFYSSYYTATIPFPYRTSP